MSILVSIVLYAVAVFIASLFGVAAARKDQPQFIFFGAVSIFFFVLAAFLQVAS